MKCELYPVSLWYGYQKETDIVQEICDGPEDGVSGNSDKNANKRF